MDRQPQLANLFVAVFEKNLRANPGQCQVVNGKYFPAEVWVANQRVWKTLFTGLVPKIILSPLKHFFSGSQMCSLISLSDCSCIGFASLFVCFCFILLLFFLLLLRLTQPCLFSCQDILRVMITGPVDTPYEHGLFVFDVKLPPDYPASPPVLHYLSQCSGRLNPNLYEDGKVCVSLLGTWTGRGSEVWTSKSNVLQVLVSIQGNLFAVNYKHQVWIATSVLRRLATVFLALQWIFSNWYLARKACFDFPYTAPPC